ncbi:MAG: 50S ribosomal protein L25 [Acidimicrobiia bacterium]
MPDITLTAELRDDLGSRPAGRIRREGNVPAVVYGLGNDPVTITVPARELGHILAGESGANTLINLDVGGDDALTLVRQIHRHPTRGDLLHVDFVRIRRDVAVSAEVPVHLIGEATGVKDGGLLEQFLFSITVQAMPGNIPVSLELNVENLNIGDQVHLSDLALPDGVATELDPESVLASIAAPRVAVPGEDGEPAAEGEGEEGAAEGGSASAADASAASDEE